MLRSKTLPSSSLRARSLTAPSPQPPPQKNRQQGTLLAGQRPLPPTLSPGNFLSKGPCWQARIPISSSLPTVSPTLSARDLGSRLELPHPSPAISSGGDLAVRLEPSSPSPGTFFPPRFITNGLLKWKLENKELFYFYRAILRGLEGRL